MKKWEQFTDEELLTMVKESKSTRELAEKIGYSPNAGGSIQIIKDMLKTKGFDTSHFLSQGWNKNNFDYTRFKNGNNIKPANALNALVALRGRKCENCQLEQWQDSPIPLEVHHIDGNHLNNELSNLQILCCNCHALTKNFRGKNITSQKETIVVSDEQLIKALHETPNVRQALLKVGLTARGANYSRAYNLLYNNNIIQSEVAH